MSFAHEKVSSPGPSLSGASADDGSEGTQSRAKPSLYVHFHRMNLTRIYRAIEYHRLMRMCSLSSSRCCYSRGRSTVSRLYYISL